MKNSKIHLPLSLLLSLLAIVPSCAPESKGPQPLDRDKFIEVYIAALEGRAKPGAANDSTLGVSLDSVLARFGTNREQFWATVESYKAKPEEWRVFFAEVSQRLEKKMADEGASKGSAGPH